MIPHDVDARRFEYLLTSGTTTSELREFFRTQKNALIMAGEKVQNLPPSEAQRIAAIKRFNADSHALLRTWFAKHPTADVIASDQIVPRLRAVEELGVVLSEEEHVALMTCALRQLYLDKPPSELVDFLRTPYPGARENASKAPVSPPTGPTSDEWVDFARAVIGNHELEEPAHPTLRSAARLLNAVKHHDSRALDDDEALATARARLEPLSAPPEPRTAVPPTPSGLQVRDLEVRPYDDSVDYTALSVIATRYSHRTETPWFAVVEAFLDDNVIFTLSRSDIARAIPLNGDVVIHKNLGLTAPPVREACLYRVEAIQTEYAAKVRATEALEQLIPVIYIPFPTGEAHSIRDYVTKYAANSKARSAVFVTADNICLRTREGSLSRVSAPDYDWLFDTWSRLEGFELPTATCVVAPLPPAEGTLDCAPLAKAAKRLLKAATDRAALPLTKAHRDELARILGEETFSASDLTRRRLIANLSSIDHAGEDYRALVDVLLQDPAIRRTVDEGVETAVAKQLADKASEVHKIENLRRESARLEHAIQKLEADRDEKVRGIKAAVHKAFGAATKRELDALGDLSLLTALLPAPKSAEPKQRSARTVDDSDPLAANVSMPSNESLKSVLLAFGLSDDKSADLAEALGLAVRCGVPIVVQGVAAIVISERLGQALAKKGSRSVDIRVGLIESVIPKEWFSDSSCDVLVLQNANMSDLSVYSPEVIRVIAQRTASRGAANSLPTLVLAAASGPASVSWPEEVAALAVKLDVARLDEIAELGQDDNAVKPVHPLQRMLFEKVERIATEQDCSTRVLRTFKQLVAG